MGVVHARWRRRAQRARSLRQRDWAVRAHSSHHEHEEGHTHHYAAWWLIFAFPDPEKVADKKPIAFDRAQPFRNLGIRVVNESAASALTVRDVELTLGSIPGSTECSRS